MDLGFLLLCSLLGITPAIIYFVLDVRLLLFSLLGITPIVIYLVLDVWKRKAYGRLPPGPPGWPVVGNLFQLGKKPHESLFNLANKYGPLMCLSLGIKFTVVISSPAMAKEVLKTHDHIFAGRIINQYSRALSHHKSSFVLCQYGSRWRMLRRISNTELFSVKRLEALQYLRRDQVHRMIHQIFEDTVKGSECVINIGHTAFQSTFNLIANMAFGRDMFDPHFPASEELKDAISKLSVLHTTRNLADYFPFLEFFDLQGVYRNTGICRKKAYDIIDKFIEDRLATRAKSSDRSDNGEDLLDVLLDLRSDEFTLTDIRGYLSDLFLAGSDTTGETIEWAMAELVRNPEKMKQAQAELETVVGLNQMVDESDADRLPYLRAIVKEVFRLHPVGPLLVPHRAESRCEIAGFVIPKDSRVLVNVWAIGRDPEIWTEPLKFVPERFLDNEMSSVDYKGQNFELLPFGAGRRMCVGLPLASRMIHLILGSLVHSFEWAPPKGMSAEQVDMTEKPGLILRKAVPLEAIARPRLRSHLY